MVKIKWCETCKARKKLSDYYKECSNIYKEFKWYLQYEEVGKKDSNIVKIPYIEISWFIFFWKKDLENFALLLRKDVMCYEYIYTWEKLEEISLSPKEKFFSKVKKETDRISNRNLRNKRICTFS